MLYILYMAAVLMPIDTSRDNSFLYHKKYKKMAKYILTSNRYNDILNDSMIHVYHIQSKTLTNRRIGP